MISEDRSQESESARRGNTTSAPLRLCGKMASFAIVLFLTGCATPPTPQQPLIIGQRVLAPDPSTTINIPPLTPPAKQWYLVDDVGIGIWLGITPPAFSPLTADH